jgi:RNAse (barnase) inhibitor barstar
MEKQDPVKKIEEQLTKEGVKKILVYDQEEVGIGDVRSWFDALVDIRLTGIETPTPEFVWTEMKKKINFLYSNYRDCIKYIKSIESENNYLKDRVLWLEQRLKEKDLP